MSLEFVFEIKSGFIVSQIICMTLRFGAHCYIFSVSDLTISLYVSLVEFCRITVATYCKVLKNDLFRQQDSISHFGGIDVCISTYAPFVPKSNGISFLFLYCMCWFVFLKEIFNGHPKIDNENTMS